MNQFIFTFLLLSFIGLELGGQDLQNLNFEEPLSNADQAVPAWKGHRLSANHQLLVQLTEPTSRVAFLKGPFENEESGYLAQDADVSYSSLVKFKVSGKVRTQNVEGEGAYIYAYGRSGKLYLNYASSKAVVGTQDWQEVTFTFFGDDRMEYVRLGCFLGGEGKAWFDDLSWTKEPFTTVEIGDDAQNYLDTFFQIASTLSLDHEKIDWDNLRFEAKQLANGAQKPSEVYDVLRYCLGRINKHSVFIDPEQTEKWSSGGNSTDNPALPPVIFSSGHRIDEHTVYLSMPGLNSGHEATLVGFADSLQSLIESLDSPKTTAWVLDLRQNTGGNCWPMLAGIGPLLGEGICGYFLNRDGTNASSWSYADGQSLANDNPITTVSRPPYELLYPNAHIAVLTGERTGSSGEVTTIAFRGHPRARSFGQATAGYSTTNSNIMMPDGGMLLLTTSVYGDRNKVTYGAEVIPDEVVKAIEPTESAQDPTLTAALAWLATFRE